MGKAKEPGWGRTREKERKQQRQQQEPTPERFRAAPAPSRQHISMHAVRLRATAIGHLSLCNYDQRNGGGGGRVEGWGERGLR